MRVYTEQTFSSLCDILMRAAQGVAVVCGSSLVVSDMVHTLTDLQEKMWDSPLSFPYYIGIRRVGTEGGTKEHCLDRCQGLGYPIVLCKIEQDQLVNWSLKITFTKGWANGDNNDMEQEFNSL